MSICTIVDKMLLHLSNFKGKEEYFEIPLGMTQTGISENLGISQAHTARELLRSKKKNEGLFEEDLRHIQYSGRKRKVYSLTEKGYKRAEEILERIKKEKIKIRQGNEFMEIPLGNVGEYIDDRFPILKALRHLDENRILDLTKIKSEEDIFVGRQKELYRTS